MSPGIELGSQTYNMRGLLNGKPATILGLYQLPGSNAIEAAKGVRKLMEELKASPKTWTMWSPSTRPWRLRKGLRK